MKLLNRKQALLSLFIAASLGGAVITDAVAQSDRSSERASRKSKSGKAEELYPQSTRQAPTIKPSSKLSSKLQKLIETFNKGEDYPGVRSQADEILANSAANEADKALAAQLAAQAAYNLDDTAAAKKYLQQAIGLNALDNNGQFQSMLMLAQLQLQDDQKAEGLATLDKYLEESKSQRPEDLILKGQALYQAERYKEAIPVLKQAIAASPEPKDTWNQLLMASYAEAGQTRRGRRCRRSACRQDAQRQEGPAQPGQHVHAGRPDGKGRSRDGQAACRRAVDRRKGIQAVVFHLRQHREQRKGRHRGYQ